MGGGFCIGEVEGVCDRDTTAYFTAQESPAVCVVTDTTKAAPNIEKLPHLTLVTLRKSFHLHYWGYQRKNCQSKKHLLLL